MARPPRRNERNAFAWSMILHLAVFAVAWASTLYEPEVVEFITYEVELVSPEPAVQAEVATPETEEVVVERPETEPEPEPETTPAPEPEPEETAPSEPEAEPEPEPEPEPSRPARPAAEEPPPPDEEARPPTTTEEPAEEAEESGEGINVRLEGVRRDYPAYYDNIIRQIFRCFRWQGAGNWETTVRFVIRRDGTVTDLEFVERSGSTAFDFEAMGAVDCAGQGRFGPLPDDLPYDRLPIQFSFRPQGT